MSETPTAYTPYFFPVVEGRELIFQSTVAPLRTVMKTHNLVGNDRFTFSISKPDGPNTYWGGDGRNETCNLFCQINHHGVSMLGYDVWDHDLQKTVRRFEHYTRGDHVESPWLHCQGFPVYPFLKEIGLYQLDSWFDVEHTIVKQGEVPLCNRWGTKTSVESIFVPYLGQEVLTVRVDYRETNTIMIYSGQGSPADFSNWMIEPGAYDGPGGIRPGRINEVWWFAWGIGPVRVYRHNEDWDGSGWVGPVETGWEYGPIRNIELIGVN